MMIRWSMASCSALSEEQKSKEVKIDIVLIENPLADSLWCRQPQ
jgi:hypothetical protein